MLGEMLAEVFSVSGLFTLFMLLLLQAVLGFDNLLYISIESKRVGEAKAPMVRQWGIGLAVLFRIVLLFVIVALFDALAEPLFGFHLSGIIEGEFTFQSMITFVGGAFIIYTAIKEISHMLTVEHIEQRGRQVEICVAGNWPYRGNEPRLLVRLHPVGHGHRE